MTTAPSPYLCRHCMEPLGKGPTLWRFNGDKVNLPWETLMP